MTQKWDSLSHFTITIHLKMFHSNAYVDLLNYGCSTSAIKNQFLLPPSHASLMTTKFAWSRSDFSSIPKPEWDEWKLVMNGAHTKKLNNKIVEMSQQSDFLIPFYVECWWVICEINESFWEFLLLAKWLWNKLNWSKKNMIIALKHM